jgi:LPS-assembly protein
VKTEQLPDDKLTGTDRQISRITLDSDPSKPLIWNVAYEDASDTTYQDDLENFAELSDEEQLTSSASATIRGDNWTVGWLIDQVDPIDPAVTGSSVKFSRQPQLTGAWSHYGEQWNVFADGDLTQFTRDSDASLTDGKRLSANLKAEYPLTAVYGALKPSALLFPRWSEATTDGTTQSEQYVTTGAGLDGQLYFENMTSSGSLHEIIPRAKLLIREPNKDPTIARFDTPERDNDTESVGQIFLDNPISGGDFVGDTREIAVSVTSRGTNTTGIETYRVTAGRTLYLADRDVTLSNTPDTTDQGPLVVESAVRFTEHFTWNTRFRSVADDETMDSATNTFKYRTSDTDYLTQRVVWDQNQAVRTDLYYSNQIGAVRLLAGMQWEPDTEERVNQVLGLEYESCCWRAAIVHAYERDQVSETNSGNSVKLQLELKGLGALGRGASTLMDRLLEDYELSEARF